jgi:hypothetical protein
MQGEALFSPCGAYRYWLSRSWDPGRAPLALVMLNPSTADAKWNDPTIRRCIAFAARDGFGGVEVMNLFAFRATAPADLKAAADPVGPDNDRHLRDLFARHASVLIAWGTHGAYRARADTVVRLAADLGTDLTCLGLSAHGQPRHPLYVKGDRKFLPFAISQAGFGAHL